MNLAEPSARARRNGLLKALRCDLKNRFSFLVLTGEVSWGVPLTEQSCPGRSGEGPFLPSQSQDQAWV